MDSKGGLLVDFITGIRDKMVWFFNSFLNWNKGWNGVVFSFFFFLAIIKGTWVVFSW